MKKIKLLFFIAIFFQLSHLAFCQKINGLSFVASGDSVQVKHIQPVLNVNANYVALMPFGFIPKLNESKLYFNTKRQWFGEREEGIYQYAKALKRKGLRLC